MHIVYFINLGGGPEALLKNLAPIFIANDIKVSIIVKNELKKNSHHFPEEMNIYPLINGGTIPYYLIRIFGWFKPIVPFIEYLIRSSQEYRLYKTLSGIDEISKIDLVEVTEGQFIKKISKRWKIITRAHGSDWSFRQFCQDQDSSLDQYLIKWQRKQHLLSKANFAISQHTQKHLTEKCKLPENLIQYVPYPIPLKKFINEDSISIPELPLKAPLILSIGRLETRKGMDTLIKAMPKVWQKFPEAHVLLLGKETEFSINELRQLIPHAKRDQILYPGFVHYSLIPSYYKAATIYVSASQYETFGYTLLEAMACSCPLVSTDRGALPELVKNERNGITLPYGDPDQLGEAITKLLNSKGKRESFTQEGRKLALQYDLPIIGQRIMDNYKMALD